MLEQNSWFVWSDMITYIHTSTGVSRFDQKETSVHCTYQLWMAVSASYILLRSSAFDVMTVLNPQAGGC